MRRVQVGLAALALILVAGTIGYVLLGFGVLDAVFQTVITVSTVGLAVPGEQAADIARQLARWGVLRICPLGQMQNPPLTWRHDGRPALGELVTWADYEL